MLSRAINNPGDIVNHFREQKSKTVFIGETYHRKVVEDFKSKCIIPIVSISIQMDEFVDGFTFIDKQGHEFPSSEGLLNQS